MGVGVGGVGIGEQGLAPDGGAGGQRQGDRFDRGSAIAAADKALG